MFGILQSRFLEIELKVVDPLGCAGSAYLEIWVGQE
jgi:hypothetical protein